MHFPAKHGPMCMQTAAAKKELCHSQARAESNSRAATASVSAWFTSKIRSAFDKSCSLPARALTQQGLTRHSKPSSTDEMDNSRTTELQSNKRAVQRPASLHPAPPPPSSRTRCSLHD